MKDKFKYVIISVVLLIPYASSGFERSHQVDQYGWDRKRGHYSSSNSRINRMGQEQIAQSQIVGGFSHPCYSGGHRIVSGRELVCNVSGCELGL